MTTTRAVAVVRRIVTATDEHGLSYVAMDGESPNRHASDAVPGFGAANAWYEKPGVVRNDGAADLGAADVGIPMHPPIGGSVFRVVDFPPDAAYTDAGKEGLFTEIGGEQARAGAPESQGKHFWFHKTDSIDYAIVIEGDMWLLLDNEEVQLRAGDIVIQRGTSHSWSNRSDQPCRMAFVLIGAAPVGVPTELTGEPS